MANPKIKDGFFPVSTELAEKLASLNIPGSEMRILWVVWRKTWGWRKDWDSIAYSQFEKATGIKHANVAKAIKSLVCKCILLSGKDGFRFNQNWDEWLIEKRKVGGMQKHTSMQKHTKTGMQKHTKTGMQKHTYNRKKDKKEINTANAARKASGLAEKKAGKIHDETPWSLEDFVTSMRSSPQRAMNILAEYADEIKANKHTKGQWKEFISRNSRAAMKLAHYTDQQISDAMAKIKENIRSPKNPKGYLTKWALETVLKYMD